ncbi:MAG: YlxR family protein [Leptolyngbyaceae bacterium]|nr:YlxR family protein [Leptolyngbyaceae bacterium]
MEKNYRRCVTCRETKHRHFFFRVVKCHDTGEVRLDEGMGRSAYVCKQKSCLSGAQRKNRMGRALRAPVPEEVFVTLNKKIEGAEEGAIASTRHNPSH